MTRLSSTAVILLLFMMVPSSIGAQGPATNSPPESAGSADNGRRLLTAAGCVNCHGQQGRGTALAPQISPPPELREMIGYVRQPTGKMPPVPGSVVSDQGLTDIFTFLKSIVPSTEVTSTRAGDPANGKKLFSGYGCYECHGRQGQGAGTGPRIGPPRIPLATVLRYVRAPTGQMPPYTAKVVSDQELADIYSFLASIPAPKSSASIPLLNQ